MNATSLNELRSTVRAAYKKGLTKSLERLATTDEFFELAQYCSYRDHELDTLDQAELNITYGEKRMLAAILDTRQEITTPKLEVIKHTAGRNYQFSVIVCVRNTAHFLPALLASLASQTFTNFQIVFVDDASTDSSLSVLSDWVQTRTNVTLVHSNVNLGPAAARNEALRFCQGDWISTIDSDDFIHANYLERVNDFIDRSPNCAMYTTRPLRVNGLTGEVADSLPLAFKYRDGDRVIDLDSRPNHIQLGATAFLDRKFMQSHSLLYDPRVQPTFEDGNLIARYLLKVSRDTNNPPLVGEISNAFYFYRSRPEKNSLVQSSWRKGERYDDQIVYGYLPLLEECEDDVPLWLGNTILYDISWYFTEELANRPRTQWIQSHPHLRSKFLENLEAVFALLPHRSHPCRNVPLTVSNAWDSLYWGSQVVGEYNQIFFGALSSPAQRNKTPTSQMAGNPLCWLSRMRIRRLVTGDSFGANLKNAIGRRARHIIKKTARIQATVIKLISPYINRYQDALVFIDRAEGAGDNAEHLFRWVTENTDEKTFFVLSKSSPSWARLRDEKIKPLPYGSVRAKLAYLSARAVISSDAVVESRQLAPHYLYGHNNAPFIFLQHGVIYNKNIKNISNWLNRINIDLIFTSTFAEYQLLTAPDSPFAIANDRVKLVGMPRWDRLRQLDASLPFDKKIDVILMPTWFPDSIYDNWFALAENLADTYNVALVLHPSIARQTGAIVAKKFQILDPRVDDFQRAISQTDAFLTDYTSAMFDALFLRKKVAFIFQNRGKIITEESSIQEIPVLDSEAAVRGWLDHGAELNSYPSFNDSDCYSRDTYRIIQEYLAR